MMQRAQVKINLRLTARDVDYSARLAARWSRYCGIVHVLLISKV